MKIWKRFRLTAGLMISLLTACNNELPEPISGEKDNYLEITFARTTRAEVDESGAGNFSEGDRIGLYVDNGSAIHYRELTYTSGEWQPRLRRSDFGMGELILAAHYPVQGETAGSSFRAAITIADDQRASGFAATDLLFARQSLPAESNRAAMIFSHALHRLRVEIKGEGVLTPSFRSRMRGTLDLLTGKVSVEEDSYGWITPRKNDDGSYEAVIFPQEVGAYREEAGLLKIPTTVREVVYKAPDQINGQPLTEFEAGKQLTIRLNLTGSGDPEWANRKVWVYGIQAPEESSWKQYYLDLGYGYYSLPWRAEYGWYDCKKVNPSGGEPDGMMCWAASASNMLHWWIDRNKPYIDRYGDKYTGPDYTYPLEKKQESDIFTCFADAFANEAGHIDAGLNWFLHGAIQSSGLPDRDNDNPGGYFKEVFPEGVLLGTNYGGLSKETFNRLIKDALAHKKAIGISRGEIRDSHAVTIWGAEFDESGDVSAIYMADNNDRSGFEQYGIGCCRYDIYYETYTGLTSTYTVYGWTYDGVVKTFVINRLFLLSLGEDYWEQYYAKQGAQTEVE